MVTDSTITNNAKKNDYSDPRAYKMPVMRWHNTQYTMHNAQCKMHNTQCTIHNTQYPNNTKKQEVYF